MKTPNTKHQTPDNLQTSNTKRRFGRFRGWFGAWSLVFIWCLVFGIWCFPSLAQTNPPAAPAAPLSIKGTLEIKYASRQSSPPPKGVKDIYTISVNVANSALFHGTITDTPQLIEGWISKTITQPRVLNYDLACDVINPKNPAQTRNVGRLLGSVPIITDGSYLYDKGTLEMNVLPMGSAGGFSSKFSGVAAGKPLVRPANWLENLKRETINITRSVNGKTTTIGLRKYDKMEFRQHVLAAGPVQIYQSVTVNGDLLYDYDKYSWFLNNLTMQYADNGVVKIDRIGGTIRWVESPQRKINGEGEYQFDVRLNEPPPSAAAIFESKASDESAFFETDSTIPALTGTMKYKDTLRGETTLNSSVTINLAGNNVTKQQAMALFKLLILSAVVPMNAD